MSTTRTPFQLRLTNGYPHPYDLDADSEQVDQWAEEAGGNARIVSGVVHFQWLHTVTVEFASVRDAEAAVARFPEWTQYGRAEDLILEIPQDADEGYAHPALIAGGMAWCGFILEPEA